MTTLRTARRTYRNPVHDGYFADPFVLRLEDRYVAYGTGATLGGHVFEVLEAEVARAKARGDDGSTERALRHLAGVLLHTPTVRAQELAEQGRADDFTAAVSALFGVEVAEPGLDAAPLRLGDAAAS